LIGGNYQAPVERDEGRIETPGDREMERVRRSEPEIEASDIDVGEASIGGMHIRRGRRRCAPCVKIR